MPKKLLTADEKTNIIKLYESKKYSHTQIAEKCGVWPHTVRYILKNSGFTLITQSEANRKYKINENYFDKIDTEKKAYFLGLLYADGYNNTSRYSVRLMLQAEDKEVIEKLNNFLQPTKPIYFEKRNKEHHKDKWGLIIANKHISHRLSEIGCVRAKSLILTFPSCLEKDMYKHFIRGYFDGDGSIWKTTRGYTFELVGTDLFLIKVQEIMIEELGLSKNRLYKKKEAKDYTTCFLRYGGKQLSKIGKWLYQDSTIFLERKYNKFKEIIN